MVAVSGVPGADSPSAQDIKRKAPAVFDSIEPCPCRESDLKGVYTTLVLSQYQ